VRDGLIGAPLLVENRTLGKRPAVGFGTPDFNQEWRITAAAGGGTLFDFGPHWIEQILDLMEGRRVVQVFGDIRTIRWGDADDHFDITIVFDDGAHARASKSDVAYLSIPFKWMILGTEGSILAGRSRKEEITVFGPDYEMTRTKAVEAVPLHENIADHIRHGTPLVITPRHAVRVMEVIGAARESAKLGKSLDTDI
jgi:predicted dehydrogenase